MTTLLSLGLSDEQALIYLIVMQNPDLGISAIARLANMGRTKIYRLVAELQTKNLVSELVQESGSVFHSQPYSSLSTLVEVKETEINQLKKSLDAFRSVIEMNDHDKKQVGIVSYHGKEGLKQVIWNTTKAKNVLKVFEVSRLNVFMDFGFSEDVRLEYLHKKIKTKDLTNETFVQGWTNVKEFAEKYAECRFIDPEELSMSFEIYIYNEVVTLIDYKSDEMFCVEIYNRPMKLILEQLFDYVWDRAIPMKITGERGQLEVEGDSTEK